MSQADQLTIPEAVKPDQHSQEIIRVWIAHQNQHFTLRVGLWDDPAAWGMLLADLARNIAKSYEQGTSLDQIASLNRIREAFNVELDNPTDANGPV